ncbi:hypothetical protein BJX68DRAFT_226176 [Aspergillus pseudodeflectus]|uniref:Zn(2)-C6 fungal-type domain-containing protein n=1 Tax=Aspergillus pseudodeflectus TaxID=176178 RepID=A0ABR4L4A1_9EURO
MPPEVASATARKRPKISRGHSGCKTCRKRGKRCDETKPACRACVRLKFECSYSIDYSFRNHDAKSFQPRVEAKEAARVLTESPDLQALEMVNCGKPTFPSSLDCGSNLEATYWGHFHRHVRHLLPGIHVELLEGATRSASLRCAALCISASNLSMLNARVQHRTNTNDHRRSVSSPLVNNLHHFQAQEYHKRALTCSISTHDSADSAAELTGLVLLAYYHHASTNHLQFRLAVWESVQFVLVHKDALLRTTKGAAALQMWYRLCISHRLSKPPAFMLEGEGPSSFGPNRFPDTFDQLFLSCILGMNSDDLIYDILIKTIELRSRLVLFRCVAGTRRIPEDSNDIGPVAYEVLNKLLGRDRTPSEQTEAEQGFVRGSNLVGLLEVQKQRLHVWKTKTDTDGLLGDVEPKVRFPRHRDAMNILYSILCDIIFEEASQRTRSDGTTPGAELSSSTLASLAENICSLAEALDFSTSNTDDIYTFSLAEVLLQLVLVWRSEPILNHILDVIWPQMERKSRGYEHSHYPTHLVKRIINKIARYWAQGRAVTFAQLAVPEDMPKVKLLDIDYPIHLVVGGYGVDGEHFIERIPLP